MGASLRCLFVVAFTLEIWLLVPWPVISLTIVAHAAVAQSRGDGVLGTFN